MCFTALLTDPTHSSDLRTGVCPGEFHFNEAACCAGLDVSGRNALTRTVPSSSYQQSLSD